MPDIVNKLPLAPISFFADKINEDEREYFKNNSGLIMDTSKLFQKVNIESILLDEALKSIRKKTAFNQVIAEYPTLLDASINMAHYFTHLTQSDGGMSLLSKCLLNGINEFNQAHKEYYMSNDPAIKMSGFINGTSSKLHEILLNHIYGEYEGSWVQWKPLTEPILSWIRRYQFTQVLIVPTSDKVSAQSYNVAANKLLFEIFNFSELNLCGISQCQKI